MDPNKNTTKEAKVSIIMNCYNGDRFLAEAINSVLSQTYTNWEIIFWDNQSTDESAKIFQSYPDPRFKYYQSEAHTNLSSARKNAISKSTGEYVAFLDVDDLWYSNKLSTQLAEFQDTDVDVVYSNYNVKNEKNKNVYIQYKENQLHDGHITSQLFKKNFVNLLTLVSRKSSISFIKNIFPNDLAFSCDYDFVIKLSFYFKFKCIKKPLGNYRIHNRNDSMPKWYHVKELQTMYQNLKNEKIMQTFGEAVSFKLVIERTKINYIKHKIENSWIKKSPKK